MKILVALLGIIVAFQEPTFRISVELQQVVTTVRDPSGNIVRGLTAENFILEENGAAQKIAHFSDDPDEPVSVGILIDNTGSMGTMPGGTISGVSAATGISRLLLQRLKADDEVALMSFSRSVRVEQGFTKDRAKVQTALVRLSGESRQVGTSIVDSLPQALAEMKKASLRKRGLIIMTDSYFGGNLSDVAKQIRNAEIPIFAFAMRGAKQGLEYPPGYACTAACHMFGTLPPQLLTQVRQPVGAIGMQDLTERFLDMVSKETGGRAVIFEMHLRDTLARIDSALAEIAAELRGQYTLGYYPSGNNRSNGQIRVRTTRQGARVFIRRELAGASTGENRQRN